MAESRRMGRGGYNDGTIIFTVFQHTVQLIVRLQEPGYGDIFIMTKVCVCGCFRVCLEAKKIVWNFCDVGLHTYMPKDSNFGFEVKKSGQRFLRTTLTRLSELMTKNHGMYVCPVL